MTTPRKTVLVTGCSAGGVGAALALAFTKAGYHVFATARTPSKLPASLHEASNVTVLALDITSSSSIAAALAQVRQQTGGRLDVLINNAGAGLTMAALDTPLEEARKLFELNFFGAFAMVKAFGPLLVEARGCVVNHASVGGLMPIAFTSMYTASKAALIIGSETWRLELAPLGVRTIALLAGGITTNFVDNLAAPPVPETSYYHGISDTIREKPEHIQFGMQPEVFAAQVLQKVESGATGRVWVGGGVGWVRMVLWLLP